MTLAFFVSSTIFACFLAEEYEGKQRIRWYLIGALTAGCATLVKGPVGFLIPTLVIAIFNGIDSRFSAMKRVFALQNWLVFLLLFYHGLSDCLYFALTSLITAL